MEIKIGNVCKSFEKKEVLKNVNLKIEKGQITSLIGPSGSGKTTLIRLILGALKTDTGKIIIGNTLVPNLKLLKKIGYMPQEDALYDDLTGTQNLKFFAGLFKISQKEFQMKEKELFAMVNLNDDKNKLVSKYSGGMKKRLSLAIAMLNNPDVYLLDEPTVGIDPILKKSIWKEFFKLKEKGKTLIVSTHVMDELINCDKAALLYKGKIIDYDTIDNLIKKTKNGRIEELFIVHEGEKK